MQSDNGEVWSFQWTTMHRFGQWTAMNEPQWTAREGAIGCNERNYHFRSLDRTYMDDEPFKRNAGRLNKRNQTTPGAPDTYLYCKSNPLIDLYVTRKSNPPIL